MSWLDRFRSPRPSMKPRGGSGRGHTGGYLSLDEQNSKLAFPGGLREFDKMFRSDPDIKRLVWMVCNPIIAGTWTVEPYGGDGAADIDREAAEFAEWVLFEHMNPKLKGHLAQALPVGIRSGFVPFEQVWGKDEYNGREVLAPKTLGLRLPRTIFKFHQVDDELTGLTQILPSGSNVELPMTDLIYYRFGAEGDNWEGISLLRSAYKPWYMKDNLERIVVIKEEREAVGVPICYPPESADGEVLDEIEEILAGLRTNEQGYIVAPGPKAEHAQDGNGWTFEILSRDSSNQGQATIHDSLSYFRGQADSAFIAEFMRLGQDGVGARAVGDVQQNPFLQSVEALAGIVEDQLDQLIARAVALNFDVEGPPKLQMSLVDSTSLEELANFVEKLVHEGALTPDEPLEDYLRERADMPAVDPVERERRKQMAEDAAEAMREGPDPDDDPKGAKRPKPKPKGGGGQQLARQDRPLRHFERWMALDQIEDTFNEARARFEHAGGPDARRIAAEMAAAPARRTAPKPPATLVDALHEELIDLYEFGRATVAAELEAQRRDDVGVIPLMARTLAADRNERRSLRRRAQLAAESIIARIWQAVSRGRLAGHDRATIQAGGEAEAMAALRAEAQLHAGGALNGGREAEAAAHADEIDGSYYTSVLDGSRCESCAVADDDVLRELDDPVRLARRPPNPDCFGGGRCRCLEAFVLEDQAPVAPGIRPEPLS